MAGEQIKVSFGELQGASSSISSSASRIDGSLSDLKQFLSPLVASWQGQAAETYNAHQQKWDSAAAEIQQVLAAIGTAVAQAADDYHAGEQQHVARW